MKTELKAKPADAMTLLEVLIVIAVIVLLAATLIPAPRYSKNTAQRISCINNLKQINLAFTLWAGDHVHQFSTEVYATNNVMMRAIASGNAWLFWQIMSNELSTPKILHCPADLQNTAATAFTPGFGDTNISYFFNLDASEAYPQPILDGDDNLAVNGQPAGTGVLPLLTNSPVSWTNQRHNRAGNIGLSDGSVEQVSDSGLKSALAGSSTNSVRLVIP
jgi:type II secretory pathway pseudopilin PulG